MNAPRTRENAPYSSATPEPDTRCVLNHHNPTTARIGHLCPGHSRRILDTLRDLVTDWASLDLVAEPGSIQTTNVRGGPIDPAAPIRLEVVAIRDSRTIWLHDGDLLPVLAVVEAWARVVREDRHLAMPRTPATMTSETNLLHDHHEWICAQDWVDDYARELRDAAACLRGVLGITPPMSVGRCPCLDDNGNECGGRLHQDRWGGHSVSCSRCHAVWDADHLRLLGRTLSDTPHVVGS